MESNNTEPHETKPAKKKKQTKGESLAEITELLEQIEAKSAEIKIARAAFDDSKEAAKIKKGVWQTKLCELQDLADTRERWAAEAKRQPLLHPKPDKSATLPDGAVSSKRIGMLRDVVRLDGNAAAVTGQEHTAFVDAKGDTFLLIAGKRIDLNPEDWTEIVDGKTEHPLLDQAEKADPGSDAWKLHKLLVLKAKLSEKAFDALESTHVPTLGDLQAKFNAHGAFWPKELGVHGRFKEAIETAFNDYLLGQV